MSFHGLMKCNTLYVCVHDCAKLMYCVTKLFCCYIAESFQDQEKILPVGHCNESALMYYSSEVCGSYFHQTMLSITEDICVLDNIIRYLFIFLKSKMPKMCWFQLLKCNYLLPFFAIHDSTLINFGGLNSIITLT